MDGSNLIPIPAETKSVMEETDRWRSASGRRAGVMSGPTRWHSGCGAGQGGRGVLLADPSDAYCTPVSPGGLKSAN